MRVNLDQKQRMQVLVAIIAGSILTTGVVLAGVMVLVAAMFLSAGYPLSWGVMWSVWMGGLAFWIGGMIPVSKHIENSTGIAAIGISVFVLTALINLGGSAIADPPLTGYYSMWHALLIGIVLASTFLTFAVSFVGLNDMPKEELEKAAHPQPVGA